MIRQAVRSVLAAYLIVMLGCAGRQSPEPNYTIAKTRWVETEELPPDPATEELDGELEGDEADVEPYEPRDPHNPSWAGIVISERRAARDGLYRIRYPELRTRYEADRQIWTVHREAYELRLELAETRIGELQPTWWDEHKGLVIGLSFFVVGVGTAMGAYALATRTK